MPADLCQAGAGELTPGQPKRFQSIERRQACQSGVGEPGAGQRQHLQVRKFLQWIKPFVRQVSIAPQHQVPQMGQIADRGDRLVANTI